MLCWIAQLLICRVAEIHLDISVCFKRLGTEEMQEREFPLQVWKCKD